MPLLLLGFSIEEIFRFWFLVGVLDVQVKLGFFVLQIIFDTTTFLLMAANPTLHYHRNTLQHSIMPTDSITRSSLSHPFNHGWQKLPQTTCHCLLRAHNFSIGKRQHDLQANNNHVDQPPLLAGRLLSYRRLLRTLLSPFVTQASPLPFLWWSKGEFHDRSYLIAGIAVGRGVQGLARCGRCCPVPAKRTVQLRSSNNFYSIVEEAYDS